MLDCKSKYYRTKTIKMNVFHYPHKVKIFIRIFSDVSPPSSLVVDVSNDFIQISWKKNTQLEQHFLVAVERVSDETLVYSRNTSATTIQVLRRFLLNILVVKIFRTGVIFFQINSTDISAGWRYRALVRVVQDAVHGLAAEADFVIRKNGLL